MNDREENIDPRTDETMALIVEKGQVLKISAVAWRERTSGDVTLMLKKFLVAKPGKPEVVVPLSWWQHGKQRFFPRWLLRFFPLRVMIYIPWVYLPGVRIPDIDAGAYFRWGKGEIGKEGS